MKLIFTGQVIDYKDDLNVVSQFEQRFPVTLSLVVPAAIYGWWSRSCWAR